jgi:outer membrane receptor protein involved in Fe transport
MHSHASRARAFALRPIVFALSSAFSLNLWAQAQAPAAPSAPAAPAAAEEKKEPLNLESIVVTGTTSATSKMRSSVSISTMSSEAIEKSGAQSTAEVLRSVPGVRAESSGGEGNANVTVRGVPISAGGARYTQFQENGLPVLLFGDFNFVTGDMFSRADYAVDRLEVVRGGSGSTLSTNSPAGIINFVTKTGEQAIGAVGLSLGVDHKSNRVDFEYGAPISKDTSYYLGGFYRRGEGARDTAGVTMESGGQLRANLLHKLGGASFIRVDLKALNDQTPTLLPVPVFNVGGTISEVPGIDPRTFTPYSRGLQPITNFGVKGGTFDINDGLTVKSTAIGGEANIELGSGVTLNNKLNISKNSGAFLGLLANDKYPTANPAQYNTLFLGANFRDLGLTVNDLKLSKAFAIDGQSKITLAGGVFFAKQTLDIDWEIGGFLTELKNNNSRQLSPYTSFFKHYVDIDYTNTAPYLSVAYEAGPLTLDASLRDDRHTAKGIYADPRNGFTVDDNRNVDYKSKFLGKSVGGNFRADKDLAFFARYSEGAAFNSDRIIFSDSAACGLNCFKGATLPVNEVKQLEGGVKLRSGSFSSFITLFQAKTKETNYDLTTGRSSANSYDATGVEVEVGYRAGGFRVGGGFTYTNAEIVGEAPNTPAAASKLGLAPNRQAKFIYQLTPSYSAGPFEVGASIVGTGKAKDAQKTPWEATLPAFVVVNPYATYAFSDNLQFNLSVNNLFDKIGYTEINDDNRMAARSINGRTVKAGLKYSF